MAETRMLPIVARELGLSLGGRPVLDAVSFEIVSAGITAVIGPNGAGKSTLLRVLDGLISPHRGALSFGARSAAVIRRAFVFQKTALVRASVATNVGLGLLPLGLSATQRRARIAGALARVGLGDRAADPARRLSGGEQQRIALARAWAIEPELLLLDEPTASLDPAASDVVEGLIAAIAASGTKVILVSHNLGQVARLAEDVLVLSAGTAVEHGTTTQILQRPSSAAARSYLKGEMPWLSFAAES